MAENNKDINLANMSDIFQNKTFRYRINGFAHACRMHDVDVITKSGIIFNTAGFDQYGNPRTSDEHSYFIAVNEGYCSNGKSVTLSGEHDNLHFVFINYYHKEKLDKKIVDLPFFIALSKKIDQDDYKFTMETDDGRRTKFMITKSQEFKERTINDDVIFYANVMDFSEILKVVKTFVFNPRLAFDTYNEMVKQQKIVVANSKLNKLTLQDEILDKPVGKIKKLINKISN